jgi:hypothetical protein
MILHAIRNCARKKPFRTEQSATAAGVLREIQFKIPLRVYKCSNCIFYHLSSTHIKDGKGLVIGR